MKPLAIFAKQSMIYSCQGYEYASNISICKQKTENIYENLMSVEKNCDEVRIKYEIKKRKRLP